MKRIVVAVLALLAIAAPSSADPTVAVGQSRWQVARELGFGGYRVSLRDVAGSDILIKIYQGGGHAMLVTYVRAAGSGIFRVTAAGGR